MIFDFIQEPLSLIDGKGSGNSNFIVLKADSPGK